MHTRLSTGCFGPRRVAALSALVVLVSYGILTLANGIVALIIGVSTMDAGAQGSLVANQTRAFALNRLAQNRINTLSTSAMFLGGAAGSAGSTIVWVWHGWMGVMAFLRRPFSAGLRHIDAQVEVRSTLPKNLLRALLF